MRRLVNAATTARYTISAATARLTPGCRRAQFRHMEGLHDVHNTSPLIPVLHAQIVVLAVNMVVMVHIHQHRDQHASSRCSLVWHARHQHADYGLESSPE